MNELICYFGKFAWPPAFISNPIRRSLNRPSQNQTCKQMVQNSQVYLRLRPLETNPPPKGVNYYVDNVGNSLTLNGTGFLVKGNELIKKTFYYQKVLDMQDPFNTINAEILIPLVTKLFSNQNCALFCLGSTGSGKSHLMETCLGDFARGLFSDEYSRLRHQDFMVYFQAYEVYGELVRDLMQRQQHGLGVKKDVLEGYIVPDAQTFTLNSMEKVLDAIAMVLQNRTANRDKAAGDKITVIYRFMIRSNSKSSVSVQNQPTD